MKYFTNCTSIEAVKQLYRKLAMENHPDKGGNLAIMQEINRQYETACKMQFHAENLNADEMNQAILDMEAYKEAIIKVAGLKGITIELVGSWLWVTGQTYQHHKLLNSQPAKFNYAKKQSDKTAWFFRTAENKVRNYGKKMSLDSIKEKYGCQLIRPSFTQQLG